MSSPADVKRLPWQISRAIMNALNARRSTFIHFVGMKWCKTMIRGTAWSEKCVEIGWNGIVSPVISAIAAPLCPAKVVEKNLPMRLSRTYESCQAEQLH